MFSEILQYTTNTFVCFKFIIMLPVLACQSILRYTFLYVLEIYFELFFYRFILEYCSTSN